MLSINKEVKKKKFKGGDCIRRFLLDCDCGGTCIAALNNLRAGKTHHCGCQTGANLNKANYIEIPGFGRRNKLKDPTYMAWAGARKRCFYPGDSHYDVYGGRGVTMCWGWNDFASFFKDMGFKPTSDHSLDRKNPDGHYSCGHCEDCLRMGWPANCRWATKEEQANNKRDSKFITMDGITLTIEQWSRRLGIGSGIVRWRIREGMSGVDALKKPVRKMKRRKK